MKKLLFAAAAMFACVSMSAQLKGDMSISGNFGIGTSSKTGTTIMGSSTTETVEKDPFTFDLGVNFGYFVVEKLEVSLGLGYDMSRYQNNQNTDSDKEFFDTKGKFSIAPGAKYYVSIVDDIFYYTPGLRFGFGFNSGTRQIDEKTTEEMHLPFVFDLALDLLAFEVKPSYNFGIGFSLGGLYYTSESVNYEEGSGDTLVKYKESENTFKLGFKSLAPTISVKWYFF